MIKYFNKEVDVDTQKYFYDYYAELDPECEEYLQFGADKCAVDNFDEFCEELNAIMIPNKEAPTKAGLKNKVQSKRCSSPKRLILLDKTQSLSGVIVFNCFI